MAISHVAEVYGAQLATGPHGRSKFGSDAHKPAVGVVLCGAGLACNGGGIVVEVVLVVESHAGTALHHALHQLQHHIGCCLAEGFAAFGREAFEHHAFVVFDAGDEDGFNIFAFVGEGGHGGGHFGDGNFGSSHGDGGHGIDGTLYAHLSGDVDHLLRRSLFH